MKENIFTFWEGQMPEYIKLCMKTWKFPYVVLNYDNLHNYTNINIKPLKRFTLPQIADYIRVHVLRDNGGYWFDTDTIMITGNLPKTNMIGDVEARTNTIGYLYADTPHMQMFDEWAKYQDAVAINLFNSPQRWSIMGNDFTDKYVQEHLEITIGQVDYCWPEVYMISGDIPRYKKYEEFYFNRSYLMEDLFPTDMLMLHNSWTPDNYKKLSEKEIFHTDCTMTNILKYALGDDKN